MSQCKEQRFRNVHARRVALSVTSLNGPFSAPLQVHVLEHICSNTPAIHWSKLKEQLPHLS